VRNALLLATASLLASLHAGSAVNLAAQVAAPPLPSWDLEALPDLKPGTAVRFEGTTLVGRPEGQFERYTPDSLFVRTRIGTRTAVPVQTLTALWVRGRATKTGAIVGGVIGAVAGAFIGGAVCSLGRSDDGIIGNAGFDAGCGAAGAGIGILIGGGTGAGLGALIPKWRLRYRSPR
jgi:hypothetical protein